MFDTQVLNVAIGLVFCFAAMSLAASTVTEGLASLVKLRANTLVSGIQNMLSDPRFNDLALKVYQHALVHPQGDGKMRSVSRWWTYDGPSYIRAENFATALVDVLQQTPGDAAQIKVSIDAIDNRQVRQLLQGIWARANGDVALIEQHVVNWFDTAMARVSGVYKRQAQLICFVVALALAAAMNVDATRVVTVLWRNPALAAQLADQIADQVKDGSAAGTDIRTAMQQLQTLPIGPGLFGDCSNWVCADLSAITRLNILGWLITATASVFGAPFWFDMLGKLVRLRGAGPKPLSEQEKLEAQAKAGQNN